MTVLLDTDIGADSDDAVALGYLLEQVRKGRCKLPLVSLSTARKGAAGCVRAILAELASTVKVGRMKKALPCDSYNYYADEVCAAFHADDRAEEAISCWREMYKSAEEPITLIIIGPQTNLAQFLKEEAALFAQKTACVYMMAGRFDCAEAEWNVLQDIAAARYIAQNLPCDGYLLPFEEGCKALTGKKYIGRRDTPIGACLQYFALHNGITDEEMMLRESWDPFTVLSAFRPELFSYSARGDWQIGSDGVCRLDPNEKGHFFVLGVKDAAKAAQAIEEAL